MESKRDKTFVDDYITRIMEENERLLDRWALRVRKEALQKQNDATRARIQQAGIADVVLDQRGAGMVTIAIILAMITAVLTYVASWTK